ncbi:MAG TPA: FtsK/SpoIIIE domain-containing protein, partial [Verrucomicrobiae bacterium]
QQLSAAHEGRKSQLTREHEARWQSLETELKEKTAPVYTAFDSANAMAEKLFPPWDPQFHENWSAPAEFAHVAKFGRLEVDVEKLAGVAPQERRPALPGPAQFSIPLMLAFPRGGSVLFETAKTGRDEAIGALNNIILRLLSNSPTNRLNFSIIDPVGLGQNFAGVTHLADYGENLISGRIWTQSAQIEKRLAELNEHMEKVIQMYLRNEYETIAEYNEKAGNIAEKYHFLVIADFPVNFSETATRRLLSIAASGARCGVFTLIHWDRRQTAPQDALSEDLRKNSVCLSGKGSDFLLAGGFPDGTKLILDTPPDAETVTEFIQAVGKDSLQANRVEVPFTQIAPAESELWSLDTTAELRVPIGRTGATKLQYLAIGQGTRQHALIAGKTGSGKSTLFHVIITNLSLWCSPDEVEFYLVDFKKGVEFQCYAAHQLPHARVVAIESDREFGLSVLQRVDEELRRRGEIFRRLGVQDLAGYKRAGGTEPVPRSLLIIDEFQEFFVEDDRIAQGAALLLDRIVRQGRAFGIHVLLGSQTLGGAYTLARTTIGQMVIRVALQCNEADAYLIMDDNNPAPRLLSRPGEGIYNDTAGTIEGNSPFQTVWLPDDVREGYLEKAHELAKKKSSTQPSPIVFAGNAPADAGENPLLRAALEAKPQAAPSAPRLWLGAPNSIKGPTEAVFHRQSGNNVLIVGQREEAALAILSVGLVSLAAQYPVASARFIVIDANAPGSPEKEFVERITKIVPHGLTLARGAEIEPAVNRLAEELKTRTESADAGHPPETFLLIHGLQKLKKLRFEEDFGFSGGDAGAANPGKQLNDLICEGPAHGIHVIAVCDTYNNVNRGLSRKALGEFEMRVLFQMSANDSASLIDSPKAGNLGLHRAIFYNEQEGYSETFRPYALPDGAWIEQAGRLLAARRG